MRKVIFVAVIMGWCSVPHLGTSMVPSATRGTVSGSPAPENSIREPELLSQPPMQRVRPTTIADRPTTSRKPATVSYEFGVLNVGNSAEFMRASLVDPTPQSVAYGPPGAARAEVIKTPDQGSARRIDFSRDSRIGSMILLRVVSFLSAKAGGLFLLGTGLLVSALLVLRRGKSSQTLRPARL
jgi:hypothetical protein